MFSHQLRANLLKYGFKFLFVMSLYNSVVQLNLEAIIFYEVI